MKAPHRWLPAVVVAAGGVVALLVGFRIGGPEAVDGGAFCVLAFLAVGVMFVRRSSG